MVHLLQSNDLPHETTASHERQPAGLKRNEAPVRASDFFKIFSAMYFLVSLCNTSRTRPKVPVPVPDAVGTKKNASHGIHAVRQSIGQ